MSKITTQHADFRKQIGMRISKIRLDKGISQRMLSSMLEMDRVTLNRIEAGKANPTLGTLERIADGLEVSIESLLVG